jgi:hypothetical protein
MNLTNERFSIIFHLSFLIISHLPFCYFREPYWPAAIEMKNEK